LLCFRGGDGERTEKGGKKSLYFIQFSGKGKEMHFPSREDPDKGRDFIQRSRRGREGNSHIDLDQRGDNSFHWQGREQPYLGLGFSAGL